MKRFLIENPKKVRGALLVFAFGLVVLGRLLPSKVVFFSGFAVLFLYVFAVISEWPDRMGMDG